MDHAELGRVVAALLEGVGSAVLWLLREGVPVLIALCVRDLLADRAAAAETQTATSTEEGER